MPPKPRLTLRSILLIGTALALLVIQLSASLSNAKTPIQSLELGARDAMLRLRGAQAPPGRSSSLPSMTSRSPGPDSNGPGPAPCWLIS